MEFSKDGDNFCEGFDCSRKRRKDERARNKNIKCNSHFRIMLNGNFGFAGCRENATYGLGYKIKLTRNKNEAVIDKAAGIADAGVKIDHIHWYVPHYTPSIQQQGILSKQILSKTPTELRFVEWSVFMKKMNTQNQWKFKLDSQERLNNPICIVLVSSKEIDKIRKVWIMIISVGYLLLVIKLLFWWKITLIAVFC